MLYKLLKNNGWECDPTLDLINYNNPRARHWVAAAEFIVAKLSASGLHIKNEGKEWQDVVGDLNQEIDDLNRQIDDLTKALSGLQSKYDAIKQHIQNFIVYDPD
jgi:chromosome segregation ATPase